MRQTKTFSTAARPRLRSDIEWPTLLLILLVYLVWGGATAFADIIGPVAAIVAIGLATTLHSSLQHEVLHGHPLPSRRMSVALVFPAIGYVIPYERFRDLHLAHHHDERLTDPYDDPESNYLDPAVWVRLPGPVRAILRVNNTLLGRVTIGPALGLGCFLAGEVRAMARGDRAVWRAWALHALGLVPVAAWLGAMGTVLWWELAAGAYLGLSILRIRTFLEHRACESVPGRSVIIEDRGPLALLFLNNNFHALHHAAPRMPWYRLPAVYAARRADILRRNGGYVFRSYAEVAARFLVTRKDPVAHPLMPMPAAGQQQAAAPVETVAPAPAQGGRETA
jgi:fatty acid desaturase